MEYGVWSLIGKKEKRKYDATLESTFPRLVLPWSYDIDNARSVVVPSDPTMQL